uniref:Uncharacterized protein n=1 Tax=viral metagenome TaxID=1070528 RepID=A0A6M3JUV2_9ZZZZ
MKEKFYYLRKANGSGLHRCGVVYLIEEHCNWKARGVALCNESEDRFIKNSDLEMKVIGGIERAKGRAERALKRMKSTGKIKRKEALEKVQGLGIEYKSELNPILNHFEEQILKDKKKETLLQDGEFRSID